MATVVQERRSEHRGPAAAAVIDIDAARSFLAVVKGGGVTMASKSIGRTPAALSMQLKKLEEMLGAQLFERSVRGMALTRDGRRFEEHARKMLAAHQAALDEFRAPALAGHVRIGLVDEFGDLRLSRLLGDFAEACPDVCVTVQLTTSSQIARDIACGELDLGVLVPGGDTPWLEGDQMLYEEPLVWVGRPGGRAIGRDPLPISAARQGCAWRRMAIEGLERSGRAYRIAYASSSFAGQMAAVSADLAITLAPQSSTPPGLTILGAADGLPDVGQCRIGVRFAEGAAQRPEVAALGAALCDAF